MTPLIIEQYVRIDSAGLTIVCLLLLAAVVALLVALPVSRARSYARGAAAAEPKLTRERDLAEAHLAAAKVTIRDQRAEIAGLRDTNARLRGQAAGIAARAMELVNAVDEPTEAQAHILRMGGRR